MNNKIHKKMGNNKIDTPEEMIEDLEQKLWESNPMEALTL